PLRQYGTPATTATGAFLFKPGDAIRGGGAARISYWLKKPAQDLTIQIIDAKGQVVRTIKGATRPSTGSGRAGGDAARGEPVEPRANTNEPVDRYTPTGGADDEEGGGRGRGPQTATMTAGLQRFAWDLQSEPVTQFPGMVLWGATQAG